MKPHANASGTFVPDSAKTPALDGRRGGPNGDVPNSDPRRGGYLD